jgi:hypothetical protein
MNSTPHVAHDLVGLEQSIAWLPWHRSTIALSLLHHSRVDSDLAGKCIHWLKADGNLVADGGTLNCSLLGVRLLQSLKKTGYSSEFASEIELCHDSRIDELGNLRRRARSFISALDFGQLNGDRAIWWMSNLIARAAIPKNLRTKSPPHYARFIDSFDQFKTGLSIRNPRHIVSSVREWIAIGDEDTANRPPYLCKWWTLLCKFIECEALDRLFVWPLVVIGDGPQQVAIALPVLVQVDGSSPDRKGKCSIVDGRILIAPEKPKIVLATDSSEETDLQNWRALVPDWAGYARDLLLNHGRHLGDAWRTRIETSNLSIHLSPGDFVLAHLFSERSSVHVSGRSAAALFATAFAAAIMNRRIPRIAITGDLVPPPNSPIDARVGPQVGEVETTVAKARHVYLSEGYDALVISQASGGVEAADIYRAEKIADAHAPEGDEKFVVEKHTHTYEVGTLANVWDVAFPNSWRRYRSVRCPEFRLYRDLGQETRSLIGEWFRHAGEIAYLPEGVTITELGSYLRWCSATVAELKPAPPGISTLCMRLTDSEKGYRGVLNLAEALRYPLDTLARIDQERPEVLSRVLSQILQIGAQYPGSVYCRAPDLLILVKTAEGELADAENDLLTLLGASEVPLRDPGRDPAWSERLGECRIVIASEPLLASLSRRQAGKFATAVEELSIFRTDFTQQQAGSVVSEERWHGQGARFLLEQLRALGLVEKIPNSGTWLLTNRIPIDSDISRRARLHQLAGCSFATSLLGLGRPGLPSESSLCGEVITEASYHFAEATACYRTIGAQEELISCRNLLTDLTGAFNLPSWQVIRFAASERLKPVEPFVAMGQELLANNADSLSDFAAVSLLQHIGERLIQLIDHRRAEGDFSTHPDVEALVSTTTRLVETVRLSLSGTKPMRSSAIEILKNKTIRRLIKNREDLKAFRHVAEELINGNGLGIEDVGPDFLQALVAELYPGREDRKTRFGLYAKIFSTGHSGYAALFLGMLGTAPSEDDAEELVAKYSKSIEPKSIKYIRSLAWRKPAGPLLDDLRSGFSRFENYYSEPAVKETRKR